ncbi:MAG: dipeptidase [Planctomycetota bacterium]
MNMRNALVVFVLLTTSCASSAPADLTARAHTLAQRCLIVDGHIDVPYRLWEQKQNGPMDDVGVRTAKGDFDLPRAREGGLDAPFFSIYVPSEEEDKGTAKELGDALIDLVEGIAAKYPDDMRIAHSSADVRAIVKDGDLAILLGMENGSPVAGDLANLDHFHARGVRYITLCHGKDNHICDSSYDTRHTHKGLSPFGREVVQRMNALGILVDVSHVSDDAFWDVMDVARVPVIASHSSLRHFVPGFERNLSDDMVRRIGRDGGVVMINFGSAFLTPAANEHAFARYALEGELEKSRGLAPDSDEMRAALEQWDREHPLPFASVADVADHIDRAVELAGVEHVGLGSDFDGVGDSLPSGLKDVSQYPNLIEELLRRGYSDGEVRKICGENLMRVLAEAERIAREK